MPKLIGNTKGKKVGTVNAINSKKIHKDEALSITNDSKRKSWVNRTTSVTAALANTKPVKS